MTIHSSAVAQVDTTYVIRTAVGIGMRDPLPEKDLDIIPGVEANVQLAFDVVLGPDGNLYFSERTTIRRFDPRSGLVHRVAGQFNSVGVFPNPAEGSPARNTNFGVVNRLAFDQQGRLIVASSQHRKIFRITNPATATATIETIAGTGVSGLTGDGGPAINASFANISDIGTESDGTIYVSEFNVPVMRFITSGGRIDRFDLGSACSVAISICRISAFTFDKKKSLIVADNVKNRLLSLSPAKQLSVLAGTGNVGFSGDGGPGVDAQFRGPGALAVDEAGNVLLSDVINHRIRRVSPSGTIATIAGNGKGAGTSIAGFSGDGGPAVDAELSQPGSIAITPEGSVYFSDVTNNRIRVLIPCTFRMESSTISYDASGGNGTAAITANETGCSWSLTSDASWISVSSPGNGRGSASAAFRVQPNATANARTGNLRVGGQLITITQSPAGVLFPQLRSAAHGASFVPGIVPGSWLVLSGTNLSPSTRTWNDADFTGARLPTVLDGVSVKIGGRDAFVYFISPTQLNVLTSALLPSGPTTVEVTTPTGKSTLPSTIAAVGPAFFLVSHVTDGKALAAAVHSDGVLVGEIGAIPGAATRPAKAGDSIALFGTGFGPTNPALAEGVLGLPPAALASQLTVTIGGQRVQVDYAGVVGPGLVQINLRVPEFLSAGRHPVVATIGSVESPSIAALVVE